MKACLTLAASNGVTRAAHRKAQLLEGTGCQKVHEAKPGRNKGGNRKTPHHAMTFVHSLPVIDGTNRFLKTVKLWMILSLSTNLPQSVLMLHPPPPMGYRFLFFKRMWNVPLSQTVRQPIKYGSKISKNLNSYIDLDYRSIIVKYLEYLSKHLEIKNTSK